ncbi:ABC transporter substrate-binding protein [Lewinella sp. W8]|uniref:ABC transporter substrate-binding protein n=1 Tax=Lewinella sp. W8 TaxID=2528208 RepID=UPI0010686792|nr:ABC transporter substrate-binding protein [Lewinella sp. W8]MTB52320.1 myristoyl transferase [Lewinella sp. W8]
MNTLRLALDWTPNINHLGFFVAREMGFYEAVGLRVDISDPSADNYATTPAKKVELGQADFALCPLESIISYQTKSQPFPLVALAAVLLEDLSAISVLAGSGIARPAELDGRKYASYRARYEDEIVRQMIRNDGGRGDLKIIYPDKLGIWDTLLNKTADATWIFLNWEGVAAERAEIPLRNFRMRDYTVPYSYSPVIAANGSLLEEKKELHQKFLEATRRGFLHYRADREAALEILRQRLPADEQDFDLQRALEVSASAFGDEGTWGRMNSANVQTFLDWLRRRGLDQSTLTPSDLMADLWQAR